MRLSQKVFAVLIGVIMASLLAADAARSAVPPFTVGVSNGFVGSKWRTHIASVSFSR